MAWICILKDFGLNWRVAEILSQIGFRGSVQVSEMLCVAKFTSWIGVGVGGTCLPIQVCCSQLVSSWFWQYFIDQRRPSVVNRGQLLPMILYYAAMLIGPPPSCRAFYVLIQIPKFFPFWLVLIECYMESTCGNKFQSFPEARLWGSSEDEDVGAGKRGLQGPGRGSHPLGWRQVQYTFCSYGIRWAESRQNVCTISVHTRNVT